MGGMKPCLTRLQVEWTLTVYSPLKQLSTSWLLLIPWWSPSTLTLVYTFFFGTNKTFRNEFSRHPALITRYQGTAAGTRVRFTGFVYGGSRCRQRPVCPLGSAPRNTVRQTRRTSCHAFRTFRGSWWESMW